MDFIAFLSESKNIDWWQQRDVVCGTGSEYPLLFFSFFLERCKNHSVGPIQILDLSEVPSDIASAQLSTSFLGVRTYYWLKNIAELDTKKRAYWYSYIQQYHGPNCLLLFSEKPIDQKSEKIVEFTVPEYLDMTSAAPVLNALVPNETKHCSVALRTVFKKRRKIMLDELCQLARYIIISGPELEQFLAHWLDVIIVPESSLFDLSKYLFARNQEAFFKVWSVVGPQYGELFWIAYWSEIFWRAYNFSRLSSLGFHDQAKKFAVRLPFNFIQGGWRTTSLNELKEALHYVYMLDADIKNGSQGMPFLNVLYLKFFLHQFDGEIIF
ncbi:MAG TPA: hypothetical protein PKD74_00860 [Candidatus Dependentiae bacterium]|nr:hypothetical protein [Candidatus Dependentiae bacterium]